MSRDPVPAAAVLGGPALHEAKRAMRNDVIAARDALPATQRGAASQAIAQRIAALPSFQSAQVLLLTLPFRSEWDTRPLIAAASAARKTVALPRVNDGTRMLDLHVVADLERETVPGYRGIPEPMPGTPAIGIEAVDWVLVPGVAFDHAGRRLGYGGGYYDRLLTLLAPEAPRVAGAFDLQIVAGVPAAPHDLVVDAIATETRLFTIARDR